MEEFDQDNFEEDGAKINENGEPLSSHDGYYGWRNNGQRAAIYGRAMERLMLEIYKNKICAGETKIKDILKEYIKKSPFRVFIIRRPFEINLKTYYKSVPALEDAFIGGEIRSHFERKKEEFVCINKKCIAFESRINRWCLNKRKNKRGEEYYKCGNCKRSLQPRFVYTDKKISLGITSNSEESIKKLLEEKYISEITKLLNRKVDNYYIGKESIIIYEAKSRFRKGVQIKDLKQCLIYVLLLNKYIEVIKVKENIELSIKELKLLHAGELSEELLEVVDNFEKMHNIKIDFDELFEKLKNTSNAGRILLGVEFDYDESDLKKSYTKDLIWGDYTGSEQFIYITKLKPAKENVKVDLGEDDREELHDLIENITQKEDTRNDSD